MNDNQIKILKNSLTKDTAIWSPDSETAYSVTCVNSFRRR